MTALCALSMVMYCWTQKQTNLLNLIVFRQRLKHSFHNDKCKEKGFMPKCVCSCDDPCRGGLKSRGHLDLPRWDLTFCPRRSWWPRSRSWRASALAPRSPTADSGCLAWKHKNVGPNYGWCFQGVIKLNFTIQSQHNKGCPNIGTYITWYYGGPCTKSGKCDLSRDLW